MASNRSNYPKSFTNTGDRFGRLKESLTGKRFGSLLVLGMYDEIITKQTKWVCLCDCGFYTVSFGFTLKSGDSKSCGCAAANKSKERWLNATDEMRLERSINAPSAKHRLSKHVLFRIWGDMKQRCFNENNKFYHQYGGRGIKVCARWLEFKNFFEDMESGYEKGLQIGRINNDDGYHKDNCRWETRKQNQRNRTNTVYVDTPKGRMLLIEAVEIYGLNRGCIVHRIKSGWPADRIFSTPSERIKK
jgi:hypothetical protein